MTGQKRRLLVLLTCLLLIPGCGSGDKRVVFHTWLGRDEVFRIEGESCLLPELMVYLTTAQRRYEQAYGEKIWETELDGVTLWDNVKEMELARLSQIKAMTLLAEEEQVELEDGEEGQLKEIADLYYQGLSDAERQIMGVDAELVYQMYCDYALADKVYDYLIKDVNPEVSDDEARTITVEHILIKTYSLDEDGSKVDFTEQERKEAYGRILEIQKLAEAGEDFNLLAARYNEDSQSQYSFRKGVMNEEFEEAAFNLGKEEISGIVETEYGYHLIKCLTTFNQEETDANKSRIVEEKREEAFGQRYRGFVDGLAILMNDALWEKQELGRQEGVDTT